MSRPPFDSFDFALLRDPEGLRENQARLATAARFDAARLYQVRQVHGARVEVAAGDPRDFADREADAIVAEPGSGAAVAVRVADCVPVLIADENSGRVVAVHAGWRGVVADVLGESARAMLESPRSGAVAQWVAAIGPCIGPCCFEVGIDVAERIAACTDRDVIVRRVSSSSGAAEAKAFVDLRLAVRARLRSIGLADANIDDVPGEAREACTRCNARTFYSYRRDGDASGRLIAVIAAR